MNDAETIRAMLAAIRAERRSIADRDAVLEEREETLLEWLKEEAPIQRALIEAGTNGSRSSTPLGKFLEIALANGAKHTTQELAELVKKNEDLAAKHESPGRAVNFLLQGWKNHGYVLKDAQDRWYLKQGH